MNNIARKQDEVKTEESKFVTFTISHEVYGVDVVAVQEIIGMTSITHVPNTVEFMKGVINLRGTVVPVIDMRSKFNMQARDYDSFTVIIIVEIGAILVGMIVDSVADVLDIPIASIQDTPHFSTKIDTDFIKGIGNTEGGLVIILDVDRILGSDDLRILEQINERL